MVSFPPNTWHKAGWVILDPQTVIRNGWVHVSKNRIIEVKTANPIGPDPVIDHGPGVLMPALTNAHTHLELGALKGKIPDHFGFETWVRHLIEKRARLDTDTIMTGIHSGIDELYRTGCGLAAEVATLGLSAVPFHSSNLTGIWFKEYLGNDSPDLNPVVERDNDSLAGHAPHTTAPELLLKLKRITRTHKYPFTIHLSESDQEIEFIETGRGAWAELLKERNIDFSTWPLPAKSPVAYLDFLDVLDKQTLAVHLLKTHRRDLDILADRRVSVVVCPRSNYRLHGHFPDIDKLVQAGLNVCLGTDSLASCDSLSIFDEMAIVGNQFSMISPQQILSMATTSGAQALGLESEYGKLAPGYYFAAIYLPIAANSTTQVFEYIVHNQWDGSIER